MNVGPLLQCSLSHCTHELDIFFICLYQMGHRFAAVQNIPSFFFFNKICNGAFSAYLRQYKEMYFLLIIFFRIFGTNVNKKVFC